MMTEEEGGEEEEEEEGSTWPVKSWPRDALPPEIKSSKFEEQVAAIDWGLEFNNKVINGLRYLIQRAALAQGCGKQSRAEMKPQQKQNQTCAC